MKIKGTHKEIEFIKNLFEELNGTFLVNFPNIKHQLLNSYQWPELDDLRLEICKCILYGLYQAAITTTNHLLELFLKLSIIYKEILVKEKENDSSRQTLSLLDSLESTYRETSDKYTGKDLYDTINIAFSLNLITNEQKDELQEFRLKYRNTYSHADRKKLYGNIKIPVQEVRIEKKKLIVDNPKEIEAYDLPIAHGLLQKIHAEQNSIYYFKCVDDTIREVFEKLFPDFNK